MKRLSAPDIKMRKGGEKLVLVTAYDATFARLAEEAGVDALLVGDSLGMVIQGHETTIPVTLDEVIYHTRCVVRGAQRTHVIADMPFMTYQVSQEDAIRNAGRLVKEGGAHAVKLEGGVRVADLIAKIVEVGIPVMGHVGLTPQSVHIFGGYKVQGRETETAKNILEDAKAVAKAGAYAIVLEGIPMELAKEITESLPIPTIGIGASMYCDGQVLVIYDLLGMDERFNPKFLKKYENLSERIKNALGTFIRDVRNGVFPDMEHSFFMGNKR